MEGRHSFWAGGWRFGRTASAFALGLVLLGCGGGTPAAGAGGGGGGAGGAGEDAAIAQAQTLFGTTMVSGTFDAGRLTITLRRGSSSGMAKLFLCPQILDFVEAAGFAPPLVTIVEEGSGKELATEASCG